VLHRAITVAVKIPYLVKRDGVFYYVRRVPKVVVDRPAALLRYFKGDRTVRVSLCTKDPVRAVEAAAEISKDFDRRVFEALDSGAVNMPRNVRPVTQEALVAIKEQRRANIERRFRQFTLLREQGGDAGEFAEDMIYQLEIDAEQVRGVLAAVAPIVGTARIASATSKIVRALALELEVAEFEAEAEEEA